MTPAPTLSGGLLALLMIALFAWVVLCAWLGPVGDPGDEL